MLKGSWEPVLSHIPFLILNNFNNICNTQIVLWDPLYSCWPNVNNITRVWFHHCIHSTECGPVFKLLIKTKYLCEILRVGWKHICLGATSYLFGILIHIFCLWVKVTASCDQNRCDKFVSQKWWHTALPAGTWLCELWWYLFQMSPMYILRPMFNLFLSNKKVYFMRLPVLST